jgi:hypothetical protein
VEEEKGGEEAAAEHYISTKIRTREQALHCTSEVMQVSKLLQPFLNFVYS